MLQVCSFCLHQQWVGVILWMTEHGGLTVKRFCSAPGGPFVFLFVLRLLSLYIIWKNLVEHRLTSDEQSFRLNPFSV